MRRLMGMLVVGAVGLSLGWATPAAEAAKKGCPPDAVQSGATCLDKYEASVWQTTNAGLITQIKNGTVTLAALTAAGAIQRGAASDDYGAGCPDTGNGCVDFYAVSIPGVTPSAFLTWFQAAAAARNAGKRLPTNAEWQAAALGTPETEPPLGPADCNTNSSGATLTGARANCVSDVGAFDLVGNLIEFVADWVPKSTTCPGWGTFSKNLMCLAGADPNSGPGVLLRGGSFNFGGEAGVFVVDGFSATPATANQYIGFRATR